MDYYIWHMAGAAEFSGYRPLGTFWYFGDGDKYGNGKGDSTDLIYYVRCTTGRGYAY